MIAEIRATPWHPWPWQAILFRNGEFVRAAVGYSPADARRRLRIADEVTVVEYV